MDTENATPSLPASGEGDCPSSSSSMQENLPSIPDSRPEKLSPNSPSENSNDSNSSNENDNRICDIQESVGIRGQEQWTVERTKLGTESAATSPSGQDSGVSMNSPDDSNGTVAESIDSASEEKEKEKEKNLPPSEKESAEEVEDATKATLSETDPVLKTLPTTCDLSLDDKGCENASSAVCGEKEVSKDSSEAATSEQESVYYIKWIQFNQNKVPVITQNENGPCPLLAIMNVLLLSGRVKLPAMMEMVTSEQLMTYLGDCILENRPENLTEASQPNYEQNVQDAMGVMYKLQTGLDVNVKFTGVGHFEYTPECIIFDLLEICLYHGWLVDPQDAATVEAVDQCSYNQLVESIISRKSSQKEDEERKGLIAEQFLYGTASQLTYHGLCELVSVVKEKELCVFFRNNHFNTMYKHNSELFLLVTDQGYMTESGVVWETLSNVEGDGHFVDAQFRTYTKPVPSSAPIPEPDIPVGTAEQIDQDLQVALLLQEEDAQQAGLEQFVADPALSDARIRYYGQR